jgi:hypothetical protein
MIEVTSFAGQNWLITPAARAVNEAPPNSISDQTWLLVMSGVAIVNLEAKTADDWLPDEVYLLPDMDGPLDYAITRWGIPQPPPNTDYLKQFTLDEWSPFAGLSSVVERDQPANAGFAVNSWQPQPFATGTDVFSGQPVGNIFTGIIVNAAVADGLLYRVSYNITLEGRIVFTESMLQ